MVRERTTTDRWAAIRPMLGEARHFAAGESVFRQGDDAHRLYVLDEGVVKIVRTNAAGSRMIVAVRRPGALLGLPSIICATPHIADAITCIPCQIRSIAARDFNECRKRSTDISNTVLETLALEAIQQIRASADAVLSARERLLRRLHELAAWGHELPSGLRRLESFWRQTDYAELIGSTREWTNALLRDLTAEGHVQRKGDWLLITPASGQRMGVNDFTNLA